MEERSIVRSEYFKKNFKKELNLIQMTTVMLWVFIRSNKWEIFCNELDKGKSIKYSFIDAKKWKKK